VALLPHQRQHNQGFRYDAGHGAVLDHGSKEGVMDREEVLGAYRKGDENKLLSLFLAYRDLRDDFSFIEQESAHDDFVIIRFPWSGKHWHKKHLIPHAA
jgi:hypothetical protein